MSFLRDLRFFILQHLDQPADIKGAVANIFNIADAALDREGWQEGDDIQSALKELEALLVDPDVQVEEQEEDDDDDDLIDIDDLPFEDDENDDDE